MKICAVVVTFNRLKLLQECIEALRNQTRKLDEIIVVNNDSTDGTKYWLDEQSDLTKIHQENLGGAGGFHHGMKAAYEKGYDWIWLMDDDCLPDVRALNVLISSGYNKEVVLNSVVLNKSNLSEINFTLYDYKNKKLYSNYKEIEKLDTINSANFFNGTLIHKNVIKYVGYPYKEFFIYGDEYEYYLRIIEKKLQILTIPTSIVFHPHQKYKNIGRGKYFYRYNYLNKLRAKHFSRNILFIFKIRKEIRLRHLFKIYIYDIYGIIFIQKEVTLIFLYILGIIKGLFLYPKLNTQP